MDKIPMTAVLLCGGQSSRMGYVPKETLTLHGISFDTLLLHQLDRFVQVAISDNKPHPGLDIPVWADLFPHCGPLSGIHAALVHMTTPYLMVAACDTPLLTQDCIKWLLTSLCPEDDALIPMTNGKSHPTCGFYHKRILPIVQAQLSAGDYRLRSLLNQIHTHYIPVPEPYISCFTNINTPQALEQLHIPPSAQGPD